MKWIIVGVVVGLIIGIVWVAHDNLGTASVYGDRASPYAGPVGPSHRFLQPRVPHGSPGHFVPTGPGNTMSLGTAVTSIISVGVGFFLLLKFKDNPVVVTLGTTLIATGATHFLGTLVTLH